VRRAGWLRCIARGGRHAPRRPICRSECRVVSQFEIDKSFFIFSIATR
jgi:hypothetical protein